MGCILNKKWSMEVISKILTTDIHYSTSHGHAGKVATQSEVCGGPVLALPYPVRWEIHLAAVTDCSLPLLS